MYICVAFYLQHKTLLQIVPNMFLASEDMKQNGVNEVLCSELRSCAV